MVLDAQYHGIREDYPGLDADLAKQMKAYRWHTDLVWASYYPLDYDGKRGPRLRMAQCNEENELEAAMKEADAQGWCRKIYQDVSLRLPWMSKVLAQMYRAEDSWQCSAREALQQQERLAHETAEKVLKEEEVEVEDEVEKYTIAAADAAAAAKQPSPLSYHDLEAEETGHLLFDGRPWWAQTYASSRVVDVAMDVDRAAVPDLATHARIMSEKVNLNLNTVHVRFRLATLLSYLEDSFGAYSVQVRAAGGVWLMAVTMMNPHNDLLTHEAMRIRDVICSVAGVSVFNLESLLKSLTKLVSEQIDGSWHPDGRLLFELACLDSHPGYAEALVCTFHFAHKMRWHSGHYYNWLNCLNHYDWKPVDDTTPMGRLSETCPMPGEGPTASVLRRLQDGQHMDDKGEEEEQQQQQQQQPREVWPCDEVQAQAQGEQERRARRAKWTGMGHTRR
jgi:hypothetical protein